MPADANLVLQASVTKVDSFTSATVDLKAGGPKGRSLVARIVYSEAYEASGSKTVTFTVEHSDNDSNWYLVASGAADVLTLSTTHQAGEIFIPFDTTKRYVRLVMTLSANTNSPTITYQAHIVPARP